jgi:geranylgeranyl pyrophosphate synthase
MAALPELPADPAADPLEHALRARAIHVLALAERLLDSLPGSESHAQLMKTHLAEGRRQAAAQPDLPAVQLPLLVHAAITGDDEPAVPVAVACTLLYLGADLFDNAADRELPPEWAIASGADVQLAAATLLAALPGVALAQLERAAPAARLWALARDFARSLTVMSAGQHDDERFSLRDDVTVEACRRMAERKVAAELALFARAGALLATDDTRLVDAYSDFGFQLGAAAGLADDTADVWLGEPSRDLLNGKRTLPVAHALQTLSGQDREQLVDLLDEATQDVGAHDAVRAALLEAGSLRYAVLVVGIYRQRALRALERAAALEGPRRHLAAYLDRVFVARFADLKLATAKSR